MNISMDLKLLPRAPMGIFESDTEFLLGQLN